MTNAPREEQLRHHATFAAERLGRIGEALAARQTLTGRVPGNVPPWAGSEDIDFGGTLAAIWMWARAQGLDGRTDFSRPLRTAWDFVRAAWTDFVPRTLGDDYASEEAAYDCALVLRAALADPGARGKPDDPPARAARLLAAHLGQLDGAAGRGFEDPGFLAWTLAEYARGVDDRGLLATARRFVDKQFGMKAPPAFASEPALTTADGLFDFSSTTATRVLAVLATEGATPLVGVWLRERIAPLVPEDVVARPLDENTWNACAAICFGRAFLVSTEPAFLRAHGRMVGALERRADEPTFTLGRAPGLHNETRATFYWALALDALVRGPA